MPFELSLRNKIVFCFLIVVIAGGSVAMVLGISLYGRTVVKRAHVQVTMNLNSAWMVFKQKVDTVSLLMQFTARRGQIIEGVSERNKAFLQQLLEQVRMDNNLDFIGLTDERGMVLVRGCYPYTADDDQSNDDMVSTALSGETAAGPQILSQGRLAREGDRLSEQAFMTFVENPRSKPRPRESETSGMVIKAAVPVIDRDEKLRGVLYGGVLLNRNYEIVDRIKNNVYRDEQYDGKEIGTAAIFQWDVRISTNVKNASDLRAIGTRASSDVCAKVLENGEPYIGRDYVVNADYITAYEPVFNTQGTIIGMLYVGTLEQPFIDTRNKVILLFCAIALLGVLTAIVIGYFLARSISRPIEKLASATREISGGHFPVDLDIPSQDEIGRLAHLFINMSRHLKQTLSDLQDLNRKYLELLGFTTHELKQPLGVLKGYLIMLQDETLGKLNTDKQREAILEMRNSVNMLNDMIMKYLQLSKIEAGKLVVEKRRFNLFAEAIKPVIEGESAYLAIKKMRLVIDNQASLRELEPHADPTLMRIVFSNLITNAIKYGFEGGTITIGHFEDAGMYYFHVRNEGYGIPRDKREVIFDKFVRLDMKELGRQVGTGLGLYNTKEIVEKHGGKIWAESDEGKWADFFFTLPRDTQPAAAGAPEHATGAI
jgi:two-component system NtrC family sensor kinase